MNLDSLTESLKRSAENLPEVDWPTLAPELADHYIEEIDRMLEQAAYAIDCLREEIASKDAEITLLKLSRNIALNRKERS